MSVRLFYLVSTLLLWAGSLRAQVYEPGFLVRSTGDTLRGELENGFWTEAPTFIRYRRAAGSPSTLFQASQLRAFSFTKGRYFRHEALSLDQAAETRLENLLHGSYIRMRTDSVLAEVLLSGPTELLRVVRPGATHYELRRPGHPALSLSERKYLSQLRNGAWVITDGNNYHNQLALYFIDCLAASEAAQAAPFTAAGLVAVAQAYTTACAPNQPLGHSWVAQAAPKRREAFRAGVLAGLRYNRLESPASSVAGCTDCGLHPFGGFYAELLQPSRTTAFYGELSLSSFRNQGAMDVMGNNVYETFDYRALLATARIGVRFLPPLPHDQQLVLGLGFEYNKVLGLSLPRPTGSSYFSTTRPFDASEAYAKPTLLPNLTLGWRRQRLTLLADGQLYRTRDVISLSDLLFASNYTVRLGASYRLGRNPDTGGPR